MKLNIMNYRKEKSQVKGGVIKPKPGIYQGITNQMYHNWPEFDALSAGGLKTLIKNSPLHFVTAQGKKGTTSTAMNFGSAAHSFILEPELDEVTELNGLDTKTKNKALKYEEIKDSYVIAPVFHRKTKAGRDAFAKFQEENPGKILIPEKDLEEMQTAWQQFKEYNDIASSKIVVTAEEMKHLEGMKEMFLSHQTARALLEGSKKELSVFWHHHAYEFQCKCRPDMTFIDFLGAENVLVDYKTCKDASPDAFGKDFVNLHYHIQAYWYRLGMEQLTGEDWEYIFIAQEKTPPYGVACYYVPADAYIIAHNDLKIATHIYNECLKVNQWPCYPDEYQTLKIPKWAKRKYAATA